jgi:signal transduction histidine kinase
MVLTHAIRRFMDQHRSGPLPWLLGALLSLVCPPGAAQIPISRATQQEAPFADPVMDGIMRHILTQMDGFNADSSLFWIDRGLRHIAGTNSPEERYFLLTYRAEVLYYEGLFTEALRDLDQSMPLAERLKDSLLIANVHNLRGLTFESIHENREALPHIRKALDWFPMHPATRYPVTELYHIHGNLGSYLMNAGLLDSAAIHFPIALRLAEAAGATRATAVAWWSLGRLALLRSDPDSALHCFDRCIDLANRYAEHDVQLDGYSGRALCLARAGLADSVRVTIARAMRHCELHPNGIGNSTLRNFARDRSIALEQVGDRSGALEAIGVWHGLDSSISAMNMKAALRIQSELLRSDGARELERVQKERLTEALARVRFSRMVILTGSMAALLAISGLYLGYRSRQRNKERLAGLELLRLQQERTIAELRIREQVGRDMHDDLGAGLSGLKLRNEMAARTEIDPAKRAYFADVAQQAGDLIGSMRQIIWAMNDDQASLEDLVVYTTNYARTYAGQYDLSITVRADGPWPPVTLSTMQRRNVFLVVKEALHNIVKHAQARQVTLGLAWTGALVVDLHDDGIGLAQGADQAAGSGLRNMLRRVTDLHGKLDVANGPAGIGGTVIRFSIPLPPNERSIAPHHER